MEKRVSFQDYAIVACGTLNMELNHLKDSGFLDARKILYTKPGGNIFLNMLIPLCLVFVLMILLNLFLKPAQIARLLGKGAGH